MLMRVRPLGLFLLIQIQLLLSMLLSLCKMHRGIWEIVPFIVFGLSHWQRIISLSFSIFCSSENFQKFGLARFRGDAGLWCLSNNFCVSDINIRTWLSQPDFKSKTCLGITIWVFNPKKEVCTFYNAMAIERMNICVGRCLIIIVIVVFSGRVCQQFLF